jgi:hypothetical protein
LVLHTPYGVGIGVGVNVGAGVKVGVAVAVGTSTVGLGVFEGPIDGVVGVSVGTTVPAALVNTERVGPSDERTTKSGRPSPLICPCCTATRFPIERANREKPL